MVRTRRNSVLDPELIGGRISSRTRSTRSSSQHDDKRVSSGYRRSMPPPFLATPGSVPPGVETSRGPGAGGRRLGPAPTLLLFGLSERPGLRDRVCWRRLYLTAPSARLSPCFCLSCGESLCVFCCKWIRVCL